MKDFKILTRYLTPSSNLIRYYSDIMKEKLLTPEEELELAILAKNGDIKAKEKIVKANLRFVISVAKFYARKNNIEDIISEGNKGLVEAIEKFDPTTEFKFITYAIWHIRKNILLYLTQTDQNIRIPINILNDVNKYNRMVNYFITEHHREPFITEILESIKNKGLKPLSKNAIDVIKQMPTTIPLENYDTEDSEFQTSPINYVSIEKDADYDLLLKEKRNIIQKILRVLSPTEQEIIMMKYGLSNEKNEKRSYREIGEILGYSADRIRQISIKAERKLKNFGKKYNLYNNFIDYSL